MNLTFMSPDTGRFSADDVLPELTSATAAIPCSTEVSLSLSPLAAAATARCLDCVSGNVRSIASCHSKLPKKANLNHTVCHLLYQHMKYNQETQLSQKNYAMIYIIENLHKLASDGTMPNFSFRSDSIRLTAKKSRYTVRFDDRCTHWNDDGDAVQASHNTCVTVNAAPLLRRK